ncbi:uncharacterized protein LOC5515075 isoform X1 [Nematostella vectensis]|uniref:uncharacterized protein LOC5515075 isoform X1 n=1 Tax=Nematostella vectensis TaxID=45351 RepID=UPI002076D6BA|nr:uncharacterized protein LOC5515075 isoform X1 [Nematostella vectensis]XP_048585577.1 uncharacterized protein LOC5515075 isoform X1 [Nematostella vectensis]XP_048585578.1 uncharacterized protein LOC5515075 isoform X1 [Nematostella vectensis]
MYVNSSAYRKQYSCETTLINLTERWKMARDERLSVNILSTDMSKAFDSMHPPLLLSKLKAYGAQDTCLRLLESYLSDRRNRVRMGKDLSSYSTVNRGCPQGSALGPLLWNIFQNDLPMSVNTELSMYADDHQIYHCGQDPGVVTAKLSASAELATAWYESNLLAGNLKKYQTLSIGYGKKANASVDSISRISINNQEIRSADSLKLLGVTIDSQLNFSEHISIACKNAGRRIGVLMRLRNLIPTNAKLVLYKSAVLPYLTYCHLTWHFCKASDSRKLERLQERALRAVFKDWNCTYHELLIKANLSTLRNRRLQDICILMYKVKNGLCPSGISDLFSKKNTNYNLRLSDFVIPRFHTVTYGKHSLRYMGAKLWNSLPRAERSIDSLKSFKVTMRKKDFEFIENCKGCALCSA